MRNLHKAFWISFAVYSVVTFLSTVIIERNENDLGFLINMKGYIPLMKYYTLVGLIFYVFAFLMVWRNGIKTKKTNSDFAIEKKELKAKISDLQRQQKAENMKGKNSEPPKTEE